MKITPELKHAIRCVFAKRKTLRSDEKYSLKEASVRAFLKKNKAAAAHLAKVQRLQKEENKAISELNDKFGLKCWDGKQPHIDSPEKFASAGGVNPDLSDPDADGTIANLALATPEQGAAILKALGINWD